MSNDLLKELSEELGCELQVNELICSTRRDTDNLTLGASYLVLLLGEDMVLVMKDDSGIGRLYPVYLFQHNSEATYDHSGYLDENYEAEN